MILGSLNRFQVLFMICAAIFALGCVRAVGILWRTGGAGVAEFSLPSAGRVSFPRVERDAFPEIGGEVTRNPFSAPTRWRKPEPARLPPPPLTGTLRLLPTPRILLFDALPRLGSVAKVEESGPYDREIIRRLRRAFENTPGGSGGGSRL